MSVYRCDYIVYGVRLPWDRELSRKLKEDGASSYNYWDGGVSNHKLIIDDMGGHYMIFGYVMYSKDYYANEAEETFMNMDPVSTNYKKKDFVYHYIQAFGEAPGLEPEAFAYSHIY
jgi:hypothetical protein